MCMFVLEIIIHMMFIFAIIYCKEGPSVMGIEDSTIQKPKKKKEKFPKRSIFAFVLYDYVFCKNVKLWSLEFIKCALCNTLYVISCGMFFNYVYKLYVFMSQRNGHVWWGFLNFKFQNQKQRLKNCPKGVFYKFVLLGYVFFWQDCEVLKFFSYFIVAHTLFMFVGCSHFFK